MRKADEAKTPPEPKFSPCSLCPDAAWCDIECLSYREFLVENNERRRFQIMMGHAFVVWHPVKPVGS